MSQVSFSVIVRSTEELAPMQTSLQRFTDQTRAQVQLQGFTWDVARQELNQMATYGRGADISQIGSTWLRGLVDMNAIRPFNALDLRKFGDPAEFIPAAWESACLYDRTTMWAVPWLVDVRILFYRRDLLKRAGIDETTAFSTPQALDQTLSALEASGVATPLVLPTQFSWRTLHAVASWVWGNGGEFFDPVGKRLLFRNAPAMEGFKAFFGLARHLTETARGLSDAESDAQFIAGDAAVTVSGPWMMEMDAARLVHVGMASPPGPAFIGGSHLIIWKHAANLRNALQLAQYLTGLEMQRKLGLGGLLPARLAALNAVNIPSREFSRYLQQILQHGRAFPASHLWALIEERLCNTLADIWNEVLALSDITDSTLNVVLERHIGALASYLEMMFL